MSGKAETPRQAPREEPPTYRVGHEASAAQAATQLNKIKSDARIYLRWETRVELDAARSRMRL